eukprot:Gb_24553 [translate_table: standard]
MPLVRYEIRNEYSLAKPDLYKSAAKDEPEELLEGVAMAGLVGIVRQLGDLAEFAAEIFYDLHEELMATASRGHELMIRVQQLEAEVPSIEKALMSETNQLRFAYTIGGDWHASIQNDQNHLSQSELPRFIRNSYEECRGPPRLFVLDKYDVAGAGACLKRYTDPSFFKKEWASSELRKVEKTQRERDTVTAKKKGRTRRNGETMDIAATSQHNSRVCYSSPDLNSPMSAPGYLLNASNQRSNFKQWKRKPTAGMVHEAQMKDNLSTGPVREFKSLKTSARDIEADRMNIMQVRQKVVLVNGQINVEMENVDHMDDVGSEADNYVDALTTMESEIETDSECPVKHEVDSDLNSEYRETGFETSEDCREQSAECSIFVDVEPSTSFYKVESSDNSSKERTCIRFHNVKSETPSEDCFESVEPPASLDSIQAVAEPGNKELIADLDSGNLPANLPNTSSSRSVDFAQTTDSVSEEALIDHVHHTRFITAADEVDAASTSCVQTPDAVLNRSSSFAFSNFEPSDVCLNATPSARFDSADASFRFAIPELSIMYSDVALALPPAIEEPFVVADTSAMHTDVKLQICPPDIEKLDESPFPLTSMDSNKSESIATYDASELASGLNDVVIQDGICSDTLNDSPVPCISVDTCRNELVADQVASEMASGLHDAVMQDKHTCIEAKVDYTEHATPTECVYSEKAYSGHKISSRTSVGCISIKSKTEIIHSESPAGCIDSKPALQLCEDLPSGSTNTSVHTLGMDIESVGDRLHAVLPIVDVLEMKSGQMNEELTDPTYTRSRLHGISMGLPPNLQNTQMPDNYSSAPFPAMQSGRDFSSDMSRDKLISRCESLKLVVNAPGKDFNASISIKKVPIDLAKAELANVGNVESPSGSPSPTGACKEGPPVEFTEAEIEGFLAAEASNVLLDMMSPVACVHSRSSVASTDVELLNFININPHTDFCAEVHAEKLSAKPPESAKDFSSELPVKCVVDSYSASAKEGSTSLGLSPLEHNNTSSFYPAAESHLSTYSACSDNELEIPRPDRNSFISETGDLFSSFHLLSEPGIPLQSEAENQSIADFGSLSSNSLEMFSQFFVDEMRFSQMIDTDYDSDCGHPKSLGKHSSDSCSNQPMEFIAEPAVFSETTTNTNGTLDSPRISLSTSSRNSSSPSTPRDSILPKLDYGGVTEGSRYPHYNNLSFGPSPKTPVSTALPSSMSQAVISLDTRAFAKSQSMDLGSELLVPSSIEARFQGSTSHETPPPPPLPPLDWWMRRTHQSSLQNTKVVEPPAPPPLPLRPTSPAQNQADSLPGIEKSSIQRNDSLIKAIASHDKSTLRKVIQQPKSQNAKPFSDREELLEQIRTRSFSLRPTVAKRPEIPRPATNINVSAILEKASAIRQAFVGSEEDEDDDWSDA